MRNMEFNRVFLHGSQKTSFPDFSWRFLTNLSSHEIPDYTGPFPRVSIDSSMFFILLQAFIKSFLDSLMLYDKRT